MTRVFLVGYYGVSNLGDELIRESAERGLAELGVDVRWYANWGHANDADPRAVRIRGRGLPRYLVACLRADGVVLGGGGILKDEGLRMPFELLATALLARLRRRPVAILAVGVGPFYTRLGRAAIRATARLATYRSVRDDASAAALAGLGVRRVTVAADPVFSLPLAAPPPRDPGCRTAVVAIRQWFLRDPAERWERFAAELAGALQPLAAAGWRIEMPALYWPRDVDAARDVAALLTGPAATGSETAQPEVVLPDAPVTAASLHADCARADLVVAMRYHSLLLAARAGTPTIAIAYEPKVQALADELRVPRVDADDPAFGERLAGLVREALEGRLARPDPAAVEALQARAREALVSVARSVER